MSSGIIFYEELANYLRVEEINEKRSYVLSHLSGFENRGILSNEHIEKLKKMIDSTGKQKSRVSESEYRKVVGILDNIIDYIEELKIKERVLSDEKKASLMQTLEAEKKIFNKNKGNAIYNKDKVEEIDKMIKEIEQRLNSYDLISRKAESELRELNNKLHSNNEELERGIEIANQLDEEISSLEVKSIDFSLSSVDNVDFDFEGDVKLKENPKRKLLYQLANYQSIMSPQEIAKFNLKNIKNLSEEEIRDFYFSKIKEVNKIKNEAEFIIKRFSQTSLSFLKDKVQKLSSHINRGEFSEAKAIMEDIRKIIRENEEVLSLEQILFKKFKDSYEIEIKDKEKTLVISNEDSKANLKIEEDKIDVDAVQETGKLCKDLEDLAREMGVEYQHKEETYKANEYQYIDE